MMISKFTIKEEGLHKWFKPKIYQSKRRGQIRNISDRHIIRMDIDQRVETGEFHLVVEFSVDRIGQDMKRILEEVI